MQVIGALELVFNQHPISRGRILAENVGPKRSNILLLRLKLKLDPCRIGEDLEVFFLREPRRKMLGLSLPDLS